MLHTILIVLLLASTVTIGAQVQSRPTEPPLVTASGETWFALREPITIAGDVYYPAGARVFFNGFTMVRSGHFNGVPVYSDTTLEPYSVLFVPVTRGILQPYERLRAGALAGTTGSRTPSFPVRLVPSVQMTVDAGPMAAVAPTAPPLPVGAIGVFTPNAERGSPVVATAANAGYAPGALSTALSTSLEPIVSVRRPENNDGLWIWFEGRRWLSRGPAVALDDQRFARIGEYAGGPVYRDTSQSGAVIYVPTRAGLVAPWVSATMAPPPPPGSRRPANPQDNRRAPETGPTREP